MIVEGLLEVTGIAINTVTADGVSPLTVAVLKSHTLVARSLLITHHQLVI